jgi:hypothetical protein
MRLLSSFTAGYELVTPPASSVTEGTVTGVPVTASQLAGVSLSASLDEQELAETASWYEERSVAEASIWARLEAAMSERS